MEEEYILKNMEPLLESEEKSESENIFTLRKHPKVLGRFTISFILGLVFISTLKFS
jgi:hypothetical protein